MPCQGTALLEAKHALELLSEIDFGSECSCPSYDITMAHIRKRAKLGCLTMVSVYPVECLWMTRLKNRKTRNTEAWGSTHSTALNKTLHLEMIGDRTKKGLQTG